MLDSLSNFIIKFRLYFVGIILLVTLFMSYNMQFVEYNYSYFPIFFVRGISIRNRIHDIFMENNIICRKYWYPLITDHDIYSNCKKINLINSKQLAESTLCLPIYPDLTDSEQSNIIDILIEELV